MSKLETANPSDSQDNTPSNTDDFAAMLDEFGGLEARSISLGDKVDAEVIHIGKEAAFCKITASQEGFIPIEDVLDENADLTVSVGDMVKVYVVKMKGGIELRFKVGRESIDVEMLEEAQRSGMPIEGQVTGANKGGLEIALGGARGFCPMGQVDINFVEDPTVFIGKTFEFLIKEVKEEGKNVVVSRRALLEAAREEAAVETLANLEVGQMVTGKVTRIVNFGAFIDLGGIDGLIPISQLSYSRVDSVEDILSLHDQVEVEVIRIEDDPKRAGQKRIGLSLKAAQPDPFESNKDLLTVGSDLEGKVVKLEKFGAFVELFPGVQGLVHISEIAQSRIRHPSDVLEIGQSVSARILSVDFDAERISLSIKEILLREEIDAGGPTVSIGKSVEGTIDRIERYGVFMKIGPDTSALLPAAETGTQRGTDLAKVFPIGSTLQVQVIDIDDRGRIKVSKTALEQAEERSLVDTYNKSQKTESFGGTFGDLLRASMDKK